MYLELTRINTCMHSDELILFDISKFIDTYNNIVEHSGVGVQIIDYSESKSQQAVVYNRGCMGTYTRTLDDTQIGIYKTGGDKIKVNSKLDGELILPLYGTDLGWLSTPDLENILEMVNSLSVSDTRFYNIQNHIIEILSGR